MSAAPPPASWDALPSEIQDRIMAERVEKTFGEAQAAHRERRSKRFLHARGARRALVPKKYLVALCNDCGIDASGSKWVLERRLSELGIPVSCAAHELPDRMYDLTMRRIARERCASKRFWLD